MLYFFVEVIVIDSQNPGVWAGTILLLFQIVDSIVTPLIGVISDKYEFKIGKRMFWYNIGFVIVTIGYFMTY